MPTRAFIRILLHIPPSDINAGQVSLLQIGSLRRGELWSMWHDQMGCSSYNFGIMPGRVARRKCTRPSSDCSSCNCAERSGTESQRMHQQWVGSRIGVHTVAECMGRTLATPTPNKQTFALIETKSRERRHPILDLMEGNRSSRPV